jgi:hypothetical protein
MRHDPMQQLLGEGSSLAPADLLAPRITTKSFAGDTRPLTKSVSGTASPAKSRSTLSPARRTRRATARSRLPDCQW